MTTLTTDDKFLLECADLGDRGIQDYGEETLKEKVLFWREKGHMWDEAKRLWVEHNEYQLQSRFYRETYQKIAELSGTVDTLDSRNYGDDKKKKLQSSIKGMQTSVNAVSKMKQNWTAITGRLERDFSGLNRSKDTLPLKGGKKISLRTGEITERTQEDLWSYEIQATGTECSEQAKADNRRYFENLCRDGDEPDATVDQEIMDYLQRLCGYWMTPEIFDKAFYILVGPSDCGKSHFMERFSSILNQRVGLCGKEVFAKGKEGNHKTYMAKLDGITMAWTSELEDGQPLNSAVIKELTGDSQTTYRKCYGRDEITMVITVKPVVLTNTTPLMDGGDSGLETRLRKIPFRHTQLVKGKPTIENQEMLARLKTQDGINATFAWFVEGAIQVYEDCDNGQSRLDPPESVVEEGKEFMEDSDSVKAFLDECCQVWTPQSNEDIRAFAYRRRPFQKDYNDFCRRQNFSKTQTLSSSLVVEKIKKLFPQNKTKDRGDWVGIRPKPAENYGL